MKLRIRSSLTYYLGLVRSDLCSSEIGQVLPDYHHAVSGQASQNRHIVGGFCEQVATILSAKVAESCEKQLNKVEKVYLP